MNSPFLRYDPSKKAVDFSAWGGIEGFLADTSNGAGGASTATLLKRISPFLSRAVDMTAVAISSLPFEIGDGGKDPLDASADWQNKLGGIPSPKRLLYLIASSLCGGKAYLVPEFAGSNLLDLHYIAPHTILPLIDQNGLEWFSRASDFGNAGVYSPIVEREPVKSSIGPKYIEQTVSHYNGHLNKDFLKTVLVEQSRQRGFNGEMIFFWLPDSDIEIGPARKHPIGAALISAQLASDMDSSMQRLAKRNFVPAHIIGAKGMPNATDREKAENWLNRFVRGAFETVVKIINAENMSVLKVGGGLEDMKTGYAEIKRDAVEGIGAAFGIPAGIFMSDKAYAQEMDVLIRTWYSSSAFVSIYQCIEDTFNEQLLDRWDVRMRFLPDTLDAFQEDETKRSAAFKQYVDAQIRPSIAAEMLGIELPDGKKYEELDEKFDKPDPVPPQVQVAQMQAQQPQKPEEKPPAKTVTLNTDQQKELVAWRERAVKWFSKGKSAVEWECKFISPEVAAEVRDKLRGAKTELEIVKAFEVSAEGDSLLALVEVLNRIADK